MLCKNITWYYIFGFSCRCCHFLLVVSFPCGVCYFILNIILFIYSISFLGAAGPKPRSGAYLGSMPSTAGFGKRGVCSCIITQNLIKQNLANFELYTDHYHMPVFSGNMKFCLFDNFKRNFQSQLAQV